MDKNVTELIKYYEGNLKNIYKINVKLDEVSGYAISALKFWKQYENPIYSITEVYPKSVNGVITQKPYYRAQSSFLNNGKKERISAYIGPISSFKGGKEDIELKKIAVKKLRNEMIKNSNLINRDLDNEPIIDKHLNEKFEEILALLLK